MMSNKDTKIRVSNAFRAMKDMGISEDKVKPVLKNLLKLFDKNWGLIESENYRALVDAIFEGEETEAAGPSKKIGNGEREDEMEEEAQATEELVRPLKRLRHKYRDAQTSSLDMSNTGVTKMSFIKPKEESDEVLESQAACQSLGKNKGRQPVSPESLIAHERGNTCQTNGISRSQQNSMLRSESRSPSHPMRLGDGGNGSLSPLISSKERRPVPESLSDAIHLKEPKVEPGTVLPPDQNIGTSPVLIKPVDGPFTDDMPPLEPPTAVIHSDPLYGGALLIRDSSIREDYGHGPSITQSISHLETADRTASPKEPRTNGNLPRLSGTVSNSKSPETMDVVPTIDFRNKSSSANAPCARNLCSSSLNELVDSQSNAQEPLPIQSTHSSHCDRIDGGSKLNEIAAGNDGTGENKHKNCARQTNKRLQATPKMSGLLHDVVDIAKGQEQVVITVVNGVNDEGPPSFYYIPKNAIFQEAYVNFSLARIGDNHCCSTCAGDCLSLDTPCACSYETGGEFAYTTDGLVKEELLKESISMNRDPKKHCQFFCKECPLERSKDENTIEPCKGHLVRKFIKECWLKCGCNKLCGNRVVQRGISRKLQVFMTPEGKGWGLRTLEDLPKGAFVCEYVGEVLTNTELFDRVLRSPKGEKHSYPVLLDADWCAEGVLKDEDALCLDATYYGNVARFINHRCYDSTMVEIPVEVETPDHHYYHLAFFTTRKVKAMEELTWDYGIDFDDHDHPIKAFRCQCGSKFCRNIKRLRRGARR